MKTKPGIDVMSPLKGAALSLTLWVGMVGHDVRAQGPPELSVPKQATKSVLDGWLNGPPGSPAPDGYTVGSIPATSSVIHFYMKTYRTWNGATLDEQIEMYFEVSVASATTITVDLDIDHNHSHASPSGTDVDRRIVITRGGSTQVFKVTSTGSSGTQLSSTAQANRNDPTLWTAEIQLSTSDLGLTVIPSVMGMYIGLNTTPVTNYPFGASPTSMNFWAHVLTRHPTDFAIVLDNSGSMLSVDGLPPPDNSRWARLKRATDLFAAALALFRDPILVDRIGISQYSWTCGDPMNGDHTGDVQGLTSSLTFVNVPAVPTGSTASFTSANTVDPAPDNCTPIERGLTYALMEQGNFDATTDPLRDRMVILLSDGLHNMPSVGFNYSAFSPKQEALVQVQTVAIGPDGVVNTLLLDNIANNFNGKTPDRARYTNTATFAQLLRAFIETLEGPFAINFVDVNAGTYSPGPADKLVFIGVWNNRMSAQNLVVQQGGATRTGTPFVSQKTGYAMAVFTNPSPTGWSIAGPSGTAAPDAVYVLADLRVYAEFIVEQRRYAAGEPMLLAASLRDQGSPVIGADVTAEIDAPATGLGNYLSTVQEDCSFGRPRLPDRFGVDSTKLSAVNARAAATASRPAAPAAQDPLPGRYQLAAADFARCKMAGLGRDSLPGQHLFDDGSHGDLIAGDGVYTLAFGGTGLEGTRNFVFHVRGRTTDGIDFTRTRRLSRYVGIVPDANATDQAIQSAGTINTLRVANVFFLPRDRLGNYLGPGFAGDFEVRSIGGELVGAVSDLENGYYRQTVRYSARGPEPIVTVAMPGTTFKKIIDFHPRPLISRIALKWLCLVIIAILLLLLLWSLKRGRATVQPSSP
jgi:hypothetical protein